MTPGEGQRRADSHDGYAPWEVRPAYRRDPEPTYPWRVVVAVLVLVFIGCAFGIGITVIQP